MQSPWRPLWAEGGRTEWCARGFTALPAVGFIALRVGEWFGARVGKRKCGLWRDGRCIASTCRCRAPNEHLSAGRCRSSRARLDDFLLSCLGAQCTSTELLLCYCTQALPYALNYSNTFQHICTTSCSGSSGNMEDRNAIYRHVSQHSTPAFPSVLPGAPFLRPARPDKSRVSERAVSCRVRCDSKQASNK